ncbi:hypothetical protein GMA14_06830 [Ruminococcus sp. zg-921]|nr:hypothetical protein [Ruminococcus sp. zg-921]
MYVQCLDCGTREALESIGVNDAEQERILETIHHHTESRIDMSCNF